MNDTCAFRFALHTAATGGNALAGPTVVEPVAVADGIFTAVLDFGDVFAQIPRLCADTTLSAERGAL